VKILTLLRHAKSGWDDKVSRDFDRPLNPKGRRAARTIGRALRAEGLAFDAAIASPALRVVETLRDVAEGYGQDIAAMPDASLYLASPAVLLDHIQATDDAVTRLLVVAHSPGLEQLALLLAGRGEDGLLDALAHKYPTGSVAELRFETDHWTELREGAGTLTRFIRPRDLDPELGPDG
jgi:phosphohistidine phosphatase